MAIKTAKEYFDQYNNGIITAIENRDEKAIDKVLGSIFMDFIAESKELIETRKVKTDKGLVGILKELDQKWRSLSTMFSKSGNDVLNYNGFRLVMKDRIPLITKYLNW